MIAAILAWLAVLAGPFFVILVLKVFPKLFADVLIKELEHSHNIHLEEFKSELTRSNSIQIEKLKAELDASYSTLKTSVDYLSVSHTELRLKRINSIETLWRVMLALHNEFSNILFVDTILTSSEIDELFKPNPNPKLRSYFSNIDEYRKRDATKEKYQRTNAIGMETERLFVSGRLWQVFYVSRAVYGRVAVLFEDSFKSNKYNDWKKDAFLESMLNSVLSSDSIARAKNMKLQGLQIIVLLLQDEFLVEAEKIMSGVLSFSKSIADMQTALLGERDKLTAEMRGGEEED